MENDSHAVAAEVAADHQEQLGNLSSLQSSGPCIYKALCRCPGTKLYVCKYCKCRFHHLCASAVGGSDDMNVCHEKCNGSPCVVPRLTAVAPPKPLSKQQAKQQAEMEFLQEKETRVKEKGTRGQSKGRKAAASSPKIGLDFFDEDRDSLLEAANSKQAGANPEIRRAFRNAIKRSSGGSTGSKDTSKASNQQGKSPDMNIVAVSSDDDAIDDDGEPGDQDNGTDGDGDGDDNNHSNHSNKGANTGNEDVSEGDPEDMDEDVIRAVRQDKDVGKDVGQDVVKGNAKDVRQDLGKPNEAKHVQELPIKQRSSRRQAPEVPDDYAPPPIRGARPTINPKKPNHRQMVFPLLEREEVVFKHPTTDEILTGEVVAQVDNENNPVVIACVMNDRLTTVECENAHNMRIVKTTDFLIYCGARFFVFGPPQNTISLLTWGSAWLDVVSEQAYFNENNQANCKILYELKRLDMMLLPQPGFSDCPVLILGFLQGTDDSDWKAIGLMNCDDDLILEDSDTAADNICYMAMADLRREYSTTMTCLVDQELDLWQTTHPMVMAYHKCMEYIERWSAGIPRWLPPKSWKQKLSVLQSKSGKNLRVATVLPKPKPCTNCPALEKQKTKASVSLSCVVNFYWLLPRSA